MKNIASAALWTSPAARAAASRCSPETASSALRWRMFQRNTSRRRTLTTARGSLKLSSSGSAASSSLSIAAKSWSGFVCSPTSESIARAPTAASRAPAALRLVQRSRQRLDRRLELTLCEQCGAEHRQQADAHRVADGQERGRAPEQTPGGGHVAAVVRPLARTCKKLCGSVRRFAFGRPSSRR